MRTLLAVRAGAAARVDPAALVLRGHGRATAARVDDAALILPEAGEGEEAKREDKGQHGDSRHEKLLSREEAAPAGMAGGRTSLGNRMAYGNEIASPLAEEGDVR
jgi:hypothetical protein